MIHSNKFFNKISNDENLVSILKSLNKEHWKDLSIIEKAALIKKMFNCVCGFYKELEDFEIEFIYDSDSLYAGTCGKYKVFLNSVILNNDFPYECVYNCAHELGHKFQDIARSMYLDTDRVYPLFSKKEVESFVINNAVSALGNVSNYIRDDSYYSNEYNAQPVEYDADHFAYSFLNFMLNNIIDNEEDKRACEKEMEEFTNICRQLEFNRDDIINFSGVYKLKYDDYIFNNSSIMRQERIIVDRYLRLLDDIDNLSRDDALLLFAPCFFDVMDINMKKNLIEKYLELEGYNVQVDLVDDDIYLEEEYLDCSDGFKVLDNIFNEIVMIDIEKIMKKPEGTLTKEEELIMFNLQDNNLILFEEMPLIYNIQPIIAYKNKCVLNKFKYFFEQLGRIYEPKDAYFGKYSKYISVYDVNAFNKKVKVLTGDNPYDAYMNALKARKNVNKVVR